MSAPGQDRTARVLLWVSAGAGIGLAALGVTRSGESAAPRPQGAIAVVNGQTISQEFFARFAGAVAAELKSVSLDTEGRRRLLQRMVDEELLLQRGVALELHRHEPTARRSIVAALIASVTADAEVEEPDEETLRTFYAENVDRFTRPGRLTLDVALVAAAGKPEALCFREAQEIARRIRAGEDFASMRRELGDPMVAELPGGSLRVETIRQYLGATVARTATLLSVGEVSDPIRGAAGYYVLGLRERLPGEIAPFEEVKAEVRGEYLRDRGDEALRAYLADLRDAAEIRILDPELAAP